MSRIQTLTKVVELAEQRRDEALSEAGALPQTRAFDLAQGQHRRTAAGTA